MRAFAAVPVAALTVVACGASKPSGSPTAATSRRALAAPACSTAVAAATNGIAGSMTARLSRASEQGSPGALLGTLRSAVGGRRSAVGAGAIEVGAGNERYAFVSLEYSAQTAAFDLAAALRDGFRGAARVGTIPVDPGPVGIAVSPDGRLLYATSEIRRSAKAADRVGTLSVIEVPRVQTHPAPAVSCRRSTRAGWG